MSDDDKKEVEEKLKHAGIAPAEKMSGGVRVARKDGGDHVAEIVHGGGGGGAPSAIEKAAHKQEVKAAHETLLPSHQKPVNNQPNVVQNNQLFQPQRFNN